MYGKDFAYAGTRLVGTIVRLLKTGEPVYVAAIGANGSCHVNDIRKINGEEVQVVHLDDLNLEPVRLGYVNSAGKATYVVRIPVRRGPNNQGLRQENSRCSDGKRLFQLQMDALRNCIIGNYPSYEKAKIGCLNNKNFGQKTIAFARHWALNGSEGANLNLLYKGRIVGSCSKTDKKPVLNDNCKYLQEALEDVL